MVTEKRIPVMQVALAEPSCTLEEDDSGMEIVLIHQKQSESEEQGSTADEESYDWDEEDETPC